MTEPRCSKCAHCTSGDQGATLHCAWEKSHLPPPVFRRRLWGVDAPKTQDNWAALCAHFQKKE